MIIPDGRVDQAPRRWSCQNLWQIQAPPLAAFLRTRTDAVPENEFSVALIPSSSEPGELEDAARTREPQPRMIWYEDSAMKHIHRELVKAGMERAREQGKRIGRPRVTERPEFLQRFDFGDKAIAKTVVGAQQR